MELQRYHPYTMLFDIFGFIKNIAIFAFMLFIVNYGSDSSFIRFGRWALLIITILTVITLIMKWLSNRYVADEQAFYIKSGIFSKTERTVYYEKVQNVQRQTSFLHKLFRMTSITFETAAGSSDSKVMFSVVTPNEADRLERLAKGIAITTTCDNEEHQEHDKAEEIPRTIHFFPTRRNLVKASFTSLSFLFLIVIIASLFSKLNALFDIEKLVEGWVLSVLTSGWFITAMIILLVAISLAVGMIRTFITYGKYEIASDEEHIYISKGILSESAFSILKKRVQAVEINQSFMKRLLGLAEVKLISAGSLGDDDEEISTLYPFLPVDHAYRIIPELLDDYEVVRKANPLPRISLYVSLVRPYWIWLIATGLLAYFRPTPFGFHATWWIISSILLLILITYRVMNYWNTNYCMHGGFIQLTKGAFGKTTYITRRDKIIEVYVKRSKLQQLTGLATIGLVNRAKPVRHEILHDVSVQDADAFYTWYAKRTDFIRKS